MSNISFKRKAGQLILVYRPDNDTSWILSKIRSDDSIDIKRTFYFSKADLVKPKIKDLEEIDIYESSDLVETFEFSFGAKENEYWKIPGDRLDILQDVYFTDSFRPKSEHFVATRKVSVFSHIAKQTAKDIYIGGDMADAMPVPDFLDLVGRFPKGYELDLYVKARLGSVLRNYFDDAPDAEAAFQNYRNKKEGVRPDRFAQQWTPYEIEKYEAIRDKLVVMLQNEEDFSEHQWQIEIKNIVCLIYPKYVCAFREARIRDGIAQTDREVDYLLMDHEGNVDLLEIKKPIGKAMLTRGQYRDNHVPVRELSGTVIQMEKYLYHLVRSGSAGEKRLNAQFAGDLPDGISIRVTNPVGMLILGRDDGLTPVQRLDFEVIKRHYRNVVDVVTYDDLLRRMGMKIKALQATGQP